MQDKRNFLRDPPAGQSAFVFNMERQAACAMATLHDDPSLQKMRTDLVPKTLTEEKFWENYFYRVSLITSSSEVSIATRHPSLATEPVLPAITCG